MRKISLNILFAILVLNIFAQETDKILYETKKDISYISVNEKDTYRRERCKLDIYYPLNKKDYPTLVWFHGGGLEGGEKHIPEELKEKGIAIIAVNYRLSPRAVHPAYIEDAAEAVAWVFNKIEQFGGTSNQIYVSGHSAGGYLCLMIGLDKSWLAKHRINADDIKGMIPVSGQTNTHYTIRKERGLSSDVPLIDNFAPLNNVRGNLPPILLITGDRNLELTARYEENAHLYAVLKSFQNNNIQLYELQGFDHGTVVGPACDLLTKFIKN